MWIRALKETSLMVALVGAGLSFSPSAGWAQVDVQKSGRVRIAVQAIGGEQGTATTKVLTDDLKRTLLVEVVPGGEAPFKASGKGSPAGLEGKLVDGTGQAILEKTYTGDWRVAAHDFADDITLATTGVKGIARCRVAFISAETGNKELYVMDIDGANAKRLTQDKIISNGPAWSHDGQWIAYTSYKSGYPDVYIIDLAKGQRTRVAAFPGLNSGPSFSPDDKFLALTLSKDGNPEIYIMPALGGEPRRITRTRGSETSPSWSPDGLTLVFSSDDRGTPQLVTTPSDGGESSRLRTSTGFDSEPDWSADGNLITYTVRQAGQFQIAIYDRISRETRQVTTQGGEDSSWTPNSRHLVYAQGGNLYLADSVTRQSLKLATGVGQCSEPAVSKAHP
jgi:TolB protein